MFARIMMVTGVAALLLSPVSVLAETNQPKEQEENLYDYIRLFGDVFERVRADYVEEPTQQQLIEAAITGMLQSLDPHSSYLDRKSYEEMKVQTRGEFGGLGIEVTMENGLVKVVSPIDDTPAFRAGVEPGDVVTHLDGEPVMGLTLSEAVDKMRGKIGTDIKLSIRREGREPFDVTITRDVIKIRSVRSRLEGNVGYVRITQFNDQADAGLKKAMKQFQDELGDRLEGVVLDLRNNPGGLLDQAVKVSDAFLDKGEIVSTRGRQAEDTTRFNATPGDLANGIPLVVLINGGSASASEIVAGALQDHKRAIVLGTKSFGKGSVQTIIPLSGHGAMRLTTSRYYTPSGRSIQAVGIEPDVAVAQARIEAVEQADRRREADLRGALDNGGENGNGATKDAPKDAPKDGTKDTPKDTPKDGTGGSGDGSQTEPEADPNEPNAKAATDYQLARALDMLRGVALFSRRMGQ